MAGTMPVSGNLSMQNLAATLTSKEQLEFVQLTRLTVDESQPRNLATFINQNAQLGRLSICAAGSKSDGTKILSTTAFITGSKIQVDIYRLPLGAARPNPDAGISEQAPNTPNDEPDDAVTKSPKAAEYADGAQAKTPMEGEAPHAEPTSDAEPQADAETQSNEPCSISTCSVGDTPAAFDSLGFQPYVDAVAKFLLDPNTKPPLTMSIEGEWGSGKSSFMLQLREAIVGTDLRQRLKTAWTESRKASLRFKGIIAKLWNAARTKRQLHIEFNPWRQEKENSPWAAFALEFMRQIGRQRGPVRRYWAKLRLFFFHYSWKGWIEGFRAIVTWAFILLLLTAVPYEVFLRKPQWATQIRNSLEPNTSAPKEGAGHSNEDLLSILVQIGGAASYFAVVLSIWLKAKDVVGNPVEIDLKKYLTSPDYEERVSFVERFHQDFKRIVDVYAGKRKVFIFVDDLDRCEVPKAAELIKAINLLIADDPRLIFILGMDRDKVAAGLAVKYEKLLPYVSDVAPETGDGGVWTRKAGLEFGRSFLQKFIQLPFRVPDPNLDTYMQFLRSVSNPGATFGGTTMLPNPPAEQPSPAIEAPSEATIAQRREREIEFGGDSDAVRTVAFMVAKALDPNPRRLKQFINMFRLQAYIANELGFFESDTNGRAPITFEQLGKFVALGPVLA